MRQSNKNSIIQSSGKLSTETPASVEALLREDADSDAHRVPEGGHQRYRNNPNRVRPKNIRLYMKLKEMYDLGSWATPG